MIYEIIISLKDGTNLFKLYDQSCSDNIHAMLIGLGSFYSQCDDFNIAENDLVIMVKNTGNEK